MAYKPFDLTGKVALITGGNGGIGLGFADALAQAGANIAIWGTNEKKNADAKAQLEKHGVKVETWRIDVASEDEVVQGMVDTASKMGRIDSVFANAGIGRGARSFLDIKAEDYRKVLSVNLDGVFWTFREGARHMVERAKNGDTSGGSLVGVASLAALHGAARNQHYAATKGAVISMVRATAVEFARYGIRANAILPGWIATDMTEGGQNNPKFTENVISRVPMKRWGQPEDFGGVAVYLTSSASSFHTGDSFLIDGAYAIF